MGQSIHLLGYVYSKGLHGEPAILSSLDLLENFLLTNLYAEQVVITDNGDNLWFESIDGVDLYSRLDDLGIDLPALFQQSRRVLYLQDEEQDIDRQPWEELYDSIGLSPGEIAMRRRVKELVKKVETVEGVIHLLDGTYFDAIFTYYGDPDNWGYFNPEECSVTFNLAEYQDDNQQPPSRVILLSPSTRVRHIASGEDIHHFELIDSSKGESIRVDEK